MTQEDKQLLLKDLSARLPYGVKVWRRGAHYVISCIDIEKQKVYLKVGFEATRGWWFDIEEVKLYLRPMSSMTEDERKEYDQLRYDPWHSHYDENICSKVLDWLNAHHFDYCGLIPMGLALEAKEGMYKTE